MWDAIQYVNSQWALAAFVVVAIIILTRGPGGVVYEKANIWHRTMALVIFGTVLLLLTLQPFLVK